MIKKLSKPVIELKDGIQSHMDNINHFPLLTKEDEIRYSDMLKNEATKEYAVEKLIESNLRLVIKIAHGFKGANLPFEDAISEGTIGLMTAARKFNYEKGGKFSTYSAWWIKNKIQRAINKNQMIRVPILTEQNKYKMDKAITAFKTSNKDTPTFNHLSEELKFSKKQIAKLKRIDTGTVSMHTPFDDSSDSNEIGDIIQDDTKVNFLESIMKNDDFKFVAKHIKELPEREQIILNMRYGLDGSKPSTLEAVSNVINLTRERVRQLENATLRNLKRIIKKNM